MNDIKILKIKNNIFNEKEGVRANSVAIACRGRHPSQVPTTSCRNRGQTKRDEES